MKRTMLTGMLVMILIALPSAHAQSADLAGYASAEADATAKVDVSGAIRAVGDAISQIGEKIRVTFEGATTTASQSKADVEARVEYGSEATQESSTQARESLLGDVRATLEWTSNVTVEPRANWTNEEESDVETMPTYTTECDHEEHEVDAHEGERLEFSAGLDYDLPPPPQPKLSFVQSIKLAFEGLFQVG